jgi:hypothetical protein
MVPVVLFVASTVGGVALIRENMRLNGVTIPDGGFAALKNSSREERKLLSAMPDSGGGGSTPASITCAWLLCIKSINALLMSSAALILILILNSEF